MHHQVLSTMYNLPTIRGMGNLTFGDWVRGQRMHRGWKQAELARRMEMDAGHISKIEHNRIGMPEEETRVRFHAVFGTTEADLIELGIVPTYDQWGRRVTASGETATVHLRESRPVYDDVNPFARDDPRWHFVETIKRVDLTNREQATLLYAVGQLLLLLDMPPDVLAKVMERTP